MGMKHFVSEFGQWIGAVGTVGGTYMQIRTHTETAVIIVMLASIAYAAFTKYKYYTKHFDVYHNRRINDSK